MRSVKTRYRLKLKEWEISNSEPYKRLHLRFALAVTLLGASIMWNIFYCINAEHAKELWWIFVLMIPATLLLYYMKKREILPPKR